ncbi:hypothetical protein Tco_1182899 [Tanacetum coccineum]
MKATMAWRCRAYDGFLGKTTCVFRSFKNNIIMVNEIPPDHVNDVPIVEPNQHDDAPVIPEPVLVDEDEDPEEDEFEEEDPQEEEDDLEVNIKEDENEPELTYPYEEMDPLNPLPPAFESEPDDEVEVEDAVESEDETVSASVYEVCESFTAAIPREDGDSLLRGFMRRDIDSLFVRSSVDQGTAAIEKLVEKLGKVEEKVKCKKLKKELEEARPNEAIDVPIEDEKSPSSEPRGSPPRHTNAGNDTRGSGPARGQDVAHAARECTFAGFMKCNPTIFHGTEGAVELLRWFEKTESVFRISDCAEGKKVRFADATMQGPALTW